MERAVTISIPLAQLPGLVGRTLGISDWILIDQARIDRFAEATGDTQWIHTDPVRAASSPAGSTIAHGLLTLSAIPALAETVWAVTGAFSQINAGSDRVRLIHPVPVDCQIRSSVSIVSVEPRPSGLRVTTNHTVTADINGQEVVVAVANFITLYSPDPDTHSLTHSVTQSLTQANH